MEIYREEVLRFYTDYWKTDAQILDWLDHDMFVKKVLTIKLVTPTDLEPYFLVTILRDAG